MVTFVKTPFTKMIIFCDSRRDMNFGNITQYSTSLSSGNFTDSTCKIYRCPDHFSSLLPSPVWYNPSVLLQEPFCWSLCFFPKTTFFFCSKPSHLWESSHGPKYMSVCHPLSLFPWVGQFFCLSGFKLGSSRKRKP